MKKIHLVLLVILMIGSFVYMSLAADRYVARQILFAKLGNGDGQVGYSSRNPAGMEMMPTDYAVDSKSNIYVCDYVNRRIIKYDKKGKYVRNIMNKGVVKPIYVYVSVDGLDNIHVFNEKGKAIENYDKDGNYKDSISDIDKFMVDMRTDYKGDIFMYENGNNVKLQKKQGAYFRSNVDYIFESPSNIIYRMDTGKDTSKIVTFKGLADYSDISRSNIPINSISVKTGARLLGVDMGENSYVVDGMGRVVSKYNSKGQIVGEATFTKYDGMGISSDKQVKIDFAGNVYKMYYLKTGIKIIKMEKK